MTSKITWCWESYILKGRDALTLLMLHGRTLPYSQLSIGSYLLTAIQMLDTVNLLYSHSENCLSNQVGGETFKRTVLSLLSTFTFSKCLTMSEDLEMQLELNLKTGRKKRFTIFYVYFLAASCMFFYYLYWVVYFYTWKLWMISTDIFFFVYFYVHT